ncbi:hypothetical protein OG874_26355 [Nocardia sp. NBC_00565]|uniref:hypothetical protein n=1 Tax=Nocardia sp. NBC_00565 TaxID=2975993 RepID=UPI002E816B68|nr:hypothetical protein [Nocardia sp. NBC_00565]WUC00406.1 hypothetical protein OG874_26355 [Nocardia sp. NBC_00565]
MSGLSRGAAGAALAAACLAVPTTLAPQANAAIAPTLSVAMTGSALGPTNLAAVGCGQTAQATAQRPDGTPVQSGVVEFTSRLPGLGGNIVGTVPISNGTATILWIPDIAGQHIVSAVYYDGFPDYQPAAGYTTVTAVNLAGVCI